MSALPGDFEAWQRNSGAGGPGSALRMLPAVLEQQAARVEMHEIFESQEIHREAHAALLLFQEAARAERLTVERVEGFIRYFKKARVNPGLRFGR